MIKHYDEIYSKKDYAGEVETILSICYKPWRILDVGCGTGNHATEFAKHAHVTGIDIDFDSITCARNKFPIQQFDSVNPTFHCMGVSEIPPGHRYDLVVSLFNVINYIDSIEELLKFFSSIKKITTDVFVFDCWNGLAAILDNPKEKVTDDVHIKVTTCLMDQSVDVDTYVKDKKFTYSYKQTLWTPWELKNILSMAGFKSVQISEWMKPDVPATEKSWKIMVVCK